MLRAFLPVSPARLSRSPLTRRPTRSLWLSLETWALLPLMGSPSWHHNRGENDEAARPLWTLPSSLGCEYELSLNERFLVNNSPIYYLFSAGNAFHVPGVRDGALLKLVDISIDFRIPDPCPLSILRQYGRQRLASRGVRVIVFGEKARCDAGQRRCGVLQFTCHQVTKSVVQEVDI